METKTYRVRDGVNWVNGQPVPKSRKVELTDAQARFDLGYARISLDGQTTASKPKGEAKNAVATTDDQKRT